MPRPGNPLGRHQRMGGPAEEPEASWAISRGSDRGPKGRGPTGGRRARSPPSPAANAPGETRATAGETEKGTESPTDDEGSEAGYGSGWSLGGKPAASGLQTPGRPSNRHPKPAGGGEDGAESEASEGSEGSVYSLRTLWRAFREKTREGCPRCALAESDECSDHAPTTDDSGDSEGMDDLAEDGATRERKTLVMSGYACRIWHDKPTSVAAVCLNGHWKVSVGGGGRRGTMMELFGRMLGWEHLPVPCTIAIDNSSSWSEPVPLRAMKDLQAAADKRWGAPTRWRQRPVVVRQSTMEEAGDGIRPGTMHALRTVVTACGRWGLGFGDLENITEGILMKSESFTGRALKEAFRSKRMTPAEALRFTGECLPERAHPSDGTDEGRARLWKLTKAGYYGWAVQSGRTKLLSIITSDFDGALQGRIALRARSMHVKGMFGKLADIAEAAGKPKTGDAVERAYARPAGQSPREQSKGHQPEQRTSKPERGAQATAAQGSARKWRIPKLANGEGENQDIARDITVRTPSPNGEEENQDIARDITVRTPSPGITKAGRRRRRDGRRFQRGKLWQSQQEQEGDWSDPGQWARMVEKERPAPRTRVIPPGYMDRNAWKKATEKVSRRVFPYMSRDRAAFRGAKRRTILHGIGYFDPDEAQEGRGLSSIDELIANVELAGSRRQLTTENCFNALDETLRGEAEEWWSGEEAESARAQGWSAVTRALRDRFADGSDDSEGPTARLNRIAKPGAWGRVQRRAGGRMTHTPGPSRDRPCAVLCSVFGARPVVLLRPAGARRNGYKETPFLMDSGQDWSSIDERTLSEFRGRRAVIGRAEIGEGEDTTDVILIHVEIALVGDLVIRAVLDNSRQPALGAIDQDHYMMSFNPRTNRIYSEWHACAFDAIMEKPTRAKGQTTSNQDLA